MLPRLFLTAFLCFVSTAATAQVLIRGRVLDANGQPPIKADLHVGGRYDDHPADYAAASDGTFHFTVPVNTLTYVRVSAVNHEEVAIPVFISASQQPVELTVQLTPDVLAKDLRPAIVGDWNDFTLSSADALQLLSDPAHPGIYSITRTATSDTLAYQLAGISSDQHTVNGTQADYYVYDGGGDYKSVIRTKKGQTVTITFDPTRYRYEHASDVRIVVSDPTLQKEIDLAMTIDRLHAQAITRYPNGAVSLPEKKLRAYRDTIVEFIAREKERDLAAAQFASALLISNDHPNTPIEEELVEQAIELTPASSPYWVLGEDYILMSLRTIDKDRAKAFRHELESNPAPSVRALAIVSEIREALQNKDNARYRELYATLKRDYSNVQKIQGELVLLNPDAAIQPGKHVPAFEVTSLDGTKISDVSMLGKYYMIDFWATWCGPCVAEMSGIHKAYAKFKGAKGFDILSLSLDATKEAIGPFRAGKWKMPWMNAFLPGAWDSPVAKQFEVVSIPKPVLVDPQGQIVAVGGELRGEALEKTLARILDGGE